MSSLTRQMVLAIGCCSLLVACHAAAPVDGQEPSKRGPESRAPGGQRVTEQPAADRPPADQPVPGDQAAPGNKEATREQESPGFDQRVGHLLQQLDADRFVDRQSAQAELLELGETALPLLMRIPPGVSRERELRQRTVALAIQRRSLWLGFGKLAARADTEIDLVEAMWLIAKVVDPTVRREPLDEQLDKLAAQTRARLGTDVDPATVAPQKAVEALRQVLFQDFGLAGSQGNYDHPDSSSLHVAFDKRRGLPILLSHILIAVADRLGVPLVGLQVPGRYMVKYDGQRAPRGFPRDDLVIDPFGGGQVLSPEELRQRIPGVDPSAYLEPSNRRATVVRMLRNLSADYAVIGQVDEANQVLRYLELVQAGPVPPE